MKFTKGRIVVILLAALLLSATACAKRAAPENQGADMASGGGNDDMMRPFAPYPDTVTVSTARQLNLGNPLAEGVTTSDNIYIDVIKDKLNVHVVIDWETTPDDYSRRLDLAIASDTLPDVFLLQSDQYLTFKWLVENGKLADLTEAYGKCVGGYDDLYLSFMDGSQNKPCLFDGKLMGIPQIPTGYNYNLLWVRQDWLNKLGLSAPRTLDDIKSIALAFQSHRMGGSSTKGIIVDPETVLGDSGNFLSLSTVANALGAYPATWIYGPDGSAMYGSIAPEMKDTLSVLRDWYESGVLDPQFMTYPDMNAVTPAMRDGQCGLFFGAYWSPWIVSYSAADPDKQWTPVFGPVDKNGVFNHTNSNSPAGYLVVSAKCGHPEAVIKAVNVAYELQRGAYNDDPAIKAEVDRLTAAGCFGRTINPFPGALSGMFDEEARRGISYMDYCQTGTLEPIPGLPLEAIQDTADKCLAWFKGDKVVRTDSDLDNRVQYESYKTIADLYNDPNQHDEPVAFSGTTESMGSYWPALSAMEKQAFIDIITGVKPVGYFDEFVSKWLETGGSTVTAEVNEIINN
ncbi:MAG: extracellular solute-binding protein [Defluviitaleaceae bacterium]|nr:extracellular solute-binding protein [Defluviitaleaceae bacterium]